jgi:choline dehydrogenase-like flavoprotein
MSARTTTQQTEVLVIGSGAGGALTARTLAEAGKHVTVIEEGPWLDADATVPFSFDELDQKYRNRGLSLAAGRPPISYAEGRCVGGSTEVNSGLWHRVPPNVLADWRATYAIDECTPEVLGAYAERLERELTVQVLPGAPPRSSEVLAAGATKLAWDVVEVPRPFHYEPGRATKQSMSRTMIPQAIAAGAQLSADTRALNLLPRSGGVSGAVCLRTNPDGSIEPIIIEADHVFVCAGAIETPALLRRSGFRGGVGHGLKVHPTIKAAARFNEPIDHADVPMHQVKEFAPDLTLGGSASRRSHIALSLADSWERNGHAMADWESIFVYYAAIRSDSTGRVRTLPGLRNPIVSYRLTDGDMSRLARGLVHLCELLFAAGAVELFPSISGAEPLRSRDELGSLWSAVTRGRANLMTVHLCSTVRMGEDRTRACADSYGRVWGTSNLYVNDASLLPDAPGVNPQGPIMAIALRNCEHFLGAA